MAKKVEVSTLNASTIDILNTIRQNAGYEYQSMVPVVTKSQDIPKVGQVIYGTPAIANQFINALVNRIALVVTKSSLFNNPYRALKKGYLEFGETVEEVFVEIAKAREFSAEKAEARELKRSLPHVRSAFHTMNWRVQYPVTIQDMDLYQAFLSMDGVQGLIAKIVDSVYKAAEYDEYLLFKYMMIKAIAGGNAYPVYVGAGTDLKQAAVKFRSTSNALTFLNTKYNASGVHTVTAREDQIIFMDSDFNAQFDVDVLASAFNMDKVDYVGRMFLIDDWTTFDNDRFSTITTNTTMLDPITSDELALMADVVAVSTDTEWFQVYDNQIKFTEKYVASGEYWNYFLNVWKTVSSSPFSNFVVYVKGSAAPSMPTTITGVITAKDIAENATVMTMTIDMEDPDFIGGNAAFVQTEDAVKAGVAIHPYGAIMFPPASTASLSLELMVNGTPYYAQTAITTATAIDAEVTFKTTKPTPSPGG